MRLCGHVCQARWRRAFVGKSVTVLYAVNQSIVEGSYVNQYKLDTIWFSWILNRPAKPGVLKKTLFIAAVYHIFRETEAV